jgi:hypothetical protein
MQSKQRILPSLVLCLTLWIILPLTADAQPFMLRKLQNVPGVVSVSKLGSHPLYKSHFEIMFEQPVDHKDSSKGTFLQRLFLLHKGFSQPMTFTTEGYAADYAGNRQYFNELAKLFSMNEIVVEHRYFGKSVPVGAGWGPLTIENAAADHHRIVQAFKTLYKKTWVSTGISKGGSAALFHKMLYPDDAYITVPYVAPLNFGAPDGRHEPFIYTHATTEYRNAILGFQIQVLLRRDSIRPMLEEYIRSRNLKYRIPINELYDYLILEYAFAFYQFGYYAQDVPWDGATYKEFFDHWITVAPPEYFAIDTTGNELAFFVQAAREFGYYGYSTRSLLSELTIENTDGYLQRIFLPDSVNYTFDPTMAYRAQNYLDTADSKMIFIYGEWDPWSASAVSFDWRNKQQMLKVVKPGGCHQTRIYNLPTGQKAEVIERLGKWLGNAR